MKIWLRILLVLGLTSIPAVLAGQEIPKSPLESRFHCDCLTANMEDGTFDVRVISFLKKVEGGILYTYVFTNDSRITGRFTLSAPARGAAKDDLFIGSFITGKGVLGEMVAIELKPSQTKIVTVLDTLGEIAEMVYAKTTILDQTGKSYGGGMAPIYLPLRWSNLGK